MTKCPSCKQMVKFKPWEGPVKVAGIPVIARGEVCTGCDEVLFTSSELERQNREAALVVVGRGIRTPRELVLVRKQTGLRAKEVAEMLGVEPETVSRWENGKLPFPRAAAYVIGDLLEHPKAARRRLQALAG